MEFSVKERNLIDRALRVYMVNIYAKAHCNPGDKAIYDAIGDEIEKVQERLIRNQ